MAQRVRLIFNPMAGPYVVASLVEDVTRFWRTRGWEVDSLETRSSGDAACLAAQAAADGCQLVLAAGGDGTIGQAAQGLAGTEVVLGVLPLGTANAFAKSLNLCPFPHPSRPDLYGVCHRLLAGQVHAMDLGRVHAAGLPPEGYRFISWAGAGLDGYLVEQVEPRPKWVKQVTGARLGWLSYAVVGVPSALKFPGVQAQVRVDQQKVEGAFVLALVSNSRLYGGGLVHLSQDARLDDGKLDIWLFKGKLFHETVGHAVRLLTARHAMSAETIHLTGRRVLIQTEEPVAVQLDGEPAGYAPLCATLEPGCLRLLVPRDAPNDLFLTPGVPFADQV